MSVGNPGHVLFALGLAFLVIGVATLLLDRMRPRSHTNGWRRTLPVVAALAVVGGSLASVASGGAAGHEDAVGGGGAHEDDVSVTREQLREINHLLSDAKAATEKYRDVDVARDEGYVQMSPVLLSSAPTSCIKASSTRAPSM